MTAANWVTLAVALIAAFASISSNRSAAKAEGKLRIEESRVNMEAQAYERARAFDTETIARQNKRIAELVREVKALKSEVETLTERLNCVDHKDDE